MDIYNSYYGFKTPIQNGYSLQSFEADFDFIYWRILISNLPLIFQALLLVRGSELPAYPFP